MRKAEIKYAPLFTSAFERVTFVWFLAVSPNTGIPSFMGDWLCAALLSSFRPAVSYLDFVHIIERNQGTINKVVPNNILHTKESYGTLFLWRVGDNQESEVKEMIFVRCQGTVSMFLNGLEIQFARVDMLRVRPVGASNEIPWFPIDIELARFKFFEKWYLNELMRLLHDSSLKDPNPMFVKLEDVGEVD